MPYDDADSCEICDSHGMLLDHDIYSVHFLLCYKCDKDIFLYRETLQEYKEYQEIIAKLKTFEAIGLRLNYDSIHVNFENLIQSKIFIIPNEWINKINELETAIVTKIIEFVKDKHNELKGDNE